MPLYRVLIVDDDPDTQLVLTKLLEHDYEALAAENGLDALTKINVIEPDLVLTDVMMPVMNGWDFVERLRQIPRFEQMPVIFLSALGQKKEIQNAYESGGNLYLTKPIEPERLLRMIDLLLRERGVPPAPKTQTLARLKSQAAEAPSASAPPAAKAPAPPATAPGKERSPDKRVPRILIVDDDEDLLKVFELELGPKFELITAHDGLNAMDMTLKWKPDVFVIDWMMPRVSGYQMVDILRRCGDFQDSPIIFISAKSSRKDRQMLERLDIQEFLQKPFEPFELTRVIEREIAKPGFRIHLNRPPLAAPKLGRRKDDYVAEDQDTFGWEG